MPGARLLIAALAVALIPSSALASSTVTAAGGVVSVGSTAAGEANRIVLAVESELLVVRDTGAATLEPGAGCSAAAAGAVSCGPAAAITRVEVRPGPGDDAVTAPPTGPRLFAWGGTGADDLIGGRGSDVLAGEAGEDTVDGSLGHDNLDGGADADVIVFDAERTETDGVNATLPAPGSASSASGPDGEVDSLAGFEVLVGSPGPDMLWGSSAAERIEGRGGDDDLRGRGGADELDGGDGNDRFENTANDGDDTIDGGGHRPYTAGSRAYGDEIAYVNGGAVRVHLADQAGPPTTGNGTIATGESDTLSGLETVVGSAGDDELTGSADRDILQGNPGDDDLAGGGGPDQLFDSGGVDAFDGGPGDDRIEAQDWTVDESFDCGEGQDGLEADLTLEATPRPNGCEVLAPQFTGELTLSGEPRVGRPITANPVSAIGDPGTTVVTWYVCVEEAVNDRSDRGLGGGGPYYDCETRATGPTYVPTAADEGRILSADVELYNAAGNDYLESPYTAAVLPPLPATEEEKPREEQPAPKQDAPAPPVAAPTPSPAPAPAPRAAAPAPAVDPLLAAARRLLGAKARLLGRVGAVRAYGAPGRGIALVCAKGRCTGKAGKKRFVLAAGKARAFRVRKGAKLRVTVAKSSRTLRAPA